MIGGVIFLAILSLILWMPCGIYARYSGAGTTAELIVGPIRINLLRSKKVKKNKVAQRKFESHEKVKEKRKISDFWPVIRLVLEFLSDFKRKLKINDLQFKIILGGSDPYTLSINYGRYWAVLGNLMPHLESWFKIKKRNLQVECDYTASATKVEASIDLRVSFVTLLHMVLNHGTRILIKYLKISKEAKDGAVS